MIKFGDRWKRPDPATDPPTKSALYDRSDFLNSRGEYSKFKLIVSEWLGCE